MTTTESPLQLGAEALAHLASEVSYEPEIRGRDDVQRELGGLLRHTDAEHRDSQLKAIVEAFVEANHAEGRDRQAHWLGEARRLSFTAVTYDLAAAAMTGQPKVKSYAECADEAMRLFTDCDEPMDPPAGPVALSLVVSR